MHPRDMIHTDLMHTNGGTIHILTYTKRHDTQTDIHGVMIHGLIHGDTQT